MLTIGVPCASVNRRRETRRFSFRRGARVLLLAAPCALLAACAGAERGSGYRFDGAALRVLQAEAERDPAPILASLRASSPEVRRVAARALGRLAPAPAAPLLPLLDDPSPWVRREAIFALGQIGHPARKVAEDSLRSRCRHGDGIERALAIEALGKIAGAGASAAALAAVEDPDPTVRGAAVQCLALIARRAVRSGASGAKALGGVASLARLASRRREENDPAVRWKLVYALALAENPETRVDLRQALDDPDPLARLFAARGLASLDADPADLVPLLRAARAPEVSPAVEAVLALAGHLGDPKAVYALHERVVRKSPIPIRLAVARALERSGTTIPVQDPRYPWIQQTLRSLLRDEAAGVRAAALRATVALFPPPEDTRILAAEHLLEESTGMPRGRQERAAYAAALGKANDARSTPTLLALSRDPDRIVREAALEALGRQGDAAAVEPLHEALGDEDFAIRTLAAQALARFPSAVDADRLLEAYRAAGSEGEAEVRMAILEAVVACGDPRAPALLAEAAVSDPVWIVREKAHDLAAETNATPPPPATMPSAERPTLDRETLHLLRRRLHAVIRFRTERGSFLLEAFPEIAPRKVSDLLHRARTGGYDGLPFHRVVPNFVVQGGDPRGDGWGSGGRFLPDEFSMLPFERGSVGNPTAGKDSGGCQIFISLVPTPHLDGRYTLFGRIREGIEVVDSIRIDDRILGTEVLAAVRAPEDASSPPSPGDQRPPPPPPPP